MHTLTVVLIGLVLGAAFMLMASQSNSKLRNAFYAFAGLWFVIAVGNMWYGVLNAGYSLQEELPVLAVVYLLPLVILWFLKGTFGFRRD